MSDENSNTFNFARVKVEGDGHGVNVSGVNLSSIKAPSSNPLFQFETPIHPSKVFGAFGAQNSAAKPGLPLSSHIKAFGEATASKAAEADAQALVVKLQKLCQQKDDAQAALKAQLQQQASELADLRARLGQLDGKTSQLEQTVRARDAEVSQLRSSLQEQKVLASAQAAPVKKEAGLFSGFSLGRASSVRAPPEASASPESASFRTPEDKGAKPKSPVFCTPTKAINQRAEQVQVHRYAVVVVSDDTAVSTSGAGLPFHIEGHQLGLGKVVARNADTFKLHHYGRMDASKKLFTPLVDHHGYPLISQRLLDSPDVVCVFDKLANPRTGGGGYLPSAVVSDLVSSMEGTSAEQRSQVAGDTSWGDDD